MGPLVPEDADDTSLRIPVDLGEIARMTLADLAEIADLLHRGRIKADEAEKIALRDRAVELEIEQLESDIANLKAEEALDAQVDRFELELALLAGEDVLTELGRIINDVLTLAWAPPPTPPRAATRPPLAKPGRKVDGEKTDNQRERDRLSAEKRKRKFARPAAAQGGPPPGAPAPVLAAVAPVPFKNWRPSQVEAAFTSKNFPASIPGGNAALPWQLERQPGGFEGFQTNWDKDGGFTTSHLIAGDAGWVIHVHRDVTGECTKAHIKYRDSEAEHQDVKPNKLVALGIARRLLPLSDRIRRPTTARK